MSDQRYPLARQGVFRTIQGEGVLLGQPMIFIRLAGCSVGCPACDTDYSVSRRVTLPELLDLVSQHLYGATKWAWITGGEPTDHNINPLVDGLRAMGLQIAVATAGVRAVRLGLSHGGVDFLSVSPHRIDDSWVLRRGDQLNIVPGLNGLELSDLDGVDVSGFSHRFVTSMADADGKPANLKECLSFVMTRSGWRLGIQAHKIWGVA